MVDLLLSICTYLLYVNYRLVKSVASRQLTSVKSLQFTADGKSDFMSHKKFIYIWTSYCEYTYSFPFLFLGPCSQYMDDNDDTENQKFLSNGMMKKKKYDEYDEEYVRGFKWVMYSVSVNIFIYYTVLQDLTPKQLKTVLTAAMKSFSITRSV